MKNSILNLICFFLPERILRMFFMCSVCRNLYKVRFIDHQLCVRFNSTLKIANDAYALNWGDKISTVFWDDNKVLELNDMVESDGKIRLTEKAIDDVTESIIKETPRYLRYGLKEMRDDVRSIITQHNFLKQCSAA